MISCPIRAVYLYCVLLPNKNNAQRDGNLVIYLANFHETDVVGVSDVYSICWCLYD